MDPFSAEGELTTLHTAFHASSYTSVLDFDTSSLSPTIQPRAKILQYRARIALGESSAVVKEIGNSPSGPALAAVQLLAKQAASPSDEKIADQAKELGEKDEDSDVIVCCGTILAAAGRRDDALNVLGKHQGSLDAIALIVQTHLLANRTDLATAEIRKARGWAQDHPLVNIAESWINLRVGGQSNYQSAFYVFEELATQPSTSSARAHLSQAICELHLGRLPEAEAAMGEALSGMGETDDIVVLENAVVLYGVTGDDAKKAEVLARLEKADKKGESEVLNARSEMKEKFAGAIGKYKPVFEPTAA